MSMREETFPNFLTKLGIVTQMIDDITQFRIRMKREQLGGEVNRNDFKDKLVIFLGY